MIIFNKKPYLLLPKSELNRNFINACHRGKLDRVKYLLTSSELKENVNIHIEDDRGFKLACNENKGYLQSEVGKPSLRRI